jgi:hypothetical protein
MLITCESLIAELRQAVPHFKLDEEWAKDSLLYPIINDFARYIIEQAGWGDGDELKASLQFLERCISDGDPGVHDLAHECVESLSVGHRAEDIKSASGPHTLALWNDISQRR